MATSLSSTTGADSCVTPPLCDAPVAPLKYFSIDFETKIRYSPNKKNLRCIGKFGQECEVPELSDIVPYKPFKLDVYQLGMIFPPLFKVSGD